MIGKFININGIKIEYLESGDINNPTLVLFHGFPSSSSMFRDLIPMLENDYHLIAPTYPGFGKSDAPSRDLFKYTFDNISDVMVKILRLIPKHLFHQLKECKNM